MPDRARCKHCHEDMHKLGEIYVHGSTGTWDCPVVAEPEEATDG